MTRLHLLLHIVTLDIEALVVPWHPFTYSVLVPDGRLAIQPVHDWYWKCSVTISYTTVRDTSGHCSYTSLIVKCRFSRMMGFTFCFNASVMTEGRPDLSASWTSVRSFVNIVHHFRTLAAFITCSPYTATSLRWISLGLTFSACKNRITPRTSQSARSLSQPVTLTSWKSSLHQLHQGTIYTLLNTPSDSSGTMKQLRGLYAQTFFTFRTTLVIRL